MLTHSVQMLPAGPGAAPFVRPVTSAEGQAPNNWKRAQPALQLPSSILVQGAITMLRDVLALFSDVYRSCGVGDRLLPNGPPLCVALSCDHARSLQLTNALQAEGMRLARGVPTCQDHNTNFPSLHIPLAPTSIPFVPSYLRHRSTVLLKCMAMSACLP